SKESRHAPYRDHPDKQAVRDFYHSEEYAPLKEFRHTFATASALVVDSV
ncbi:DUF1330 domain-containing protein, partial [Streptomyces sp.]